MTHADRIAVAPPPACEIRTADLPALHEQLFYERTQPFADVVRTRLRGERENRGLSQAQLAEAMTAADTPLDGSAISKIETGKREVSAEELFAFANVLEVPLARLVSPLEGDLAVRFGGIGLDRHEVANWLVWGAPWSRESLSAQLRTGLTRRIQAIRQVIADERDPTSRKEQWKMLAAQVDGLSGEPQLFDARRGAAGYAMLAATPRTQPSPKRKGRLVIDGRGL